MCNNYSFVLKWLLKITFCNHALILNPKKNQSTSKSLRQLNPNLFFITSKCHAFFHEINSQPKEVVEISNRTVYSCVISPMFPIYLHKNGCANYFGHLKSFEDCQALYKHTYKRASIFSLWCGFYRNRCANDEVIKRDIGNRVMSSTWFTH